MITALVIAFSGSDSGAASGPAESADSRAQSVLTAARVSASDKCPHARGAVRFYKRRYSEHRERMGAPARTPVSGLTGCPQTRFLARIWRSRSYVARKAAEVVAALRARERMHPKWIALRLLKGDREQWGCLMYIVSVENAKMDPTLDFGHGHGNVYEAYGIPQANPGTKMASHGPDWRTNPETQLRWMIDYCKGRYGSVCGAAYARRTRGWY